MSAAGAIATRPRTAPPQAVRSLLLGNFFGPTGTPQVCEELSERLRIAGWPTLTASRYRNRLLRILDMTNSVWQRRNEYDVAQLDVFSGRAFCWAQACSEALLACRKPFVVSLHGGGLPRFADENPARVARLLRSAAAVTAPSAYLARRFRSVRSDIAEIPNPIDLTRHAFRLRRPIVPRIIWLRAFHEIYDPLGAVDVLRGVLAACPEAHLVMVGADRGDGSFERTQAYCRRLGLQNHVEFAGPIPKSDVPQYLDRADVFLNTSRIDNAPVSVTEAMASGLPIVSSNAGGIRDLLTHGQDGLLFDPGDSQGMAEGLIRIATEPGVAEQLVRNARETVRGFDWSVILPQWQLLLARVAGTR
jgi:glycosyltransferase involved in cell wall biosynthesis